MSESETLPGCVKSFPKRKMNLARVREKFSETEDVGVASRNAFELGIQQPANDVVGAVAIAREIF